MFNFLIKRKILQQIKKNGVYVEENVTFLSKKTADLCGVLNQSSYLLNKLDKTIDALANYDYLRIRVRQLENEIDRLKEMKEEE